MNTEERIHKLEGLLERVQRNAQSERRAKRIEGPEGRRARPEQARAAAPTPARVEEPSSEPELEVAAPVVPSEPPPEEVEVIAPSEAPPPASQPVMRAAAPAAPVDDSVDELLSAPAQAPEVAVRGPAETIAEVELLEEDDIIDITPEDELAPPPAAQEEPGAFDLDRFTEDEEPPASSRRPKVAASMDEALAGAAAELEEREAPLKTPPPESGRQIATSPPGPLQQPPPPADLATLRGDQDVDDLLGSAPAVGPTPEQLGQTVELGEPTAAELELEQTVVGAAALRHDEELEVTLPGSPVAGSYDAELAPPSGARADLERRQVKAAPKAEAKPAESELTSRVYERAPVAAKAPATFVERVAASEPSTFLELLDASLGLHAD